MPFASILDRFRRTTNNEAPQTEFFFKRGGILELKQPELFSQTSLLSFFEDPRLKLLLRKSDQSPQKLQNAVELTMVFCKAMDQKYQLYERKNLKFSRARFQINFDDEVPSVHFLPMENLIELPIQILLVTTVTPELIIQFKLWGDEEADHCIFNQFKSSSTVNLPFQGDKVDYVVPDHEFHALQSNIRQAYREQMPIEKIQDMKALLTAARIRRATKKPG